MFKIDLTTNRLVRLEPKTFGDLGLKERAHLQEWIAHMPNVLGEPLLIIQKEFDGFEDTRERLDLLALDRDGRLVLIENRDVVWQSIKYAAYVSSLSKAQVADIFQQYLDRHEGGGNAQQRICEFLEVDEFDEVVVNSRNSQRIVLIAANFRREVTATALWLLGNDISVQCFAVTPHAHGDDVLLDIRQIIPVREASEFMIGVARKENDERVSQEVQKVRHTRRLRFWTQTLESLRSSDVRLYANISPSQDHWMSAGCGIGGCHYSLIFSQYEARVELVFARAETSENKWLFDELNIQRDQIDAAFGAKLDWDRGTDERKKAIIRFAKDFDGYDEDNWPAMIEWLVANVARLEQVFADRLQVLGQELRKRRV